MKTEKQPLWRIACNAFREQRTEMLDDRWVRSTAAVIAEHERRKAIEREKEADLKQAIHEFVNKPEWKLPDPPDGAEWHRTDWTQAMLPEGWRPLYVGETGDYEASGDGTQWEQGMSPDYPTVKASHVWMRTTRPLPPVTFAGILESIKDETPITHVGLPDPFAAEKAAFAAGKTIQYYSKSSLEWLDCYPCPPSWAPDYEYRVKPEPALVPLGPDDVPPFSAIRWSGWETTEWALVLRVTNETVYFSDRRAGSATLNDLRAGNVKINRSIPLTGKWDAEAWTACFKEVQP